MQTLCKENERWTFDDHRDACDDLYFRRKLGAEDRSIEIRLIHPFAV
jgi:hypothetical protein